MKCKIVNKKKANIFAVPSPIAPSVALQILRTGGRVFDPWLDQYSFFPRIDANHCDSIHSSVIAVPSFDNGYVEKQPVAWKEYCAEYWLTLSQ